MCYIWYNACDLYVITYIHPVGTFNKQKLHIETQSPEKLLDDGKTIQITPDLTLEADAQFFDCEEHSERDACVETPKKLEQTTALPNTQRKLLTIAPPAPTLPNQDRTAWPMPQSSAASSLELPIYLAFPLSILSAIQQKLISLSTLLSFSIPLGDNSNEKAPTASKPLPQQEPLANISLPGNESFFANQPDDYQWLCQQVSDDQLICLAADQTRLRNYYNHEANNWYEVVSAQDFQCETDTNGIIHCANEKAEYVEYEKQEQANVESTLTNAAISGLVQDAAYTIFPEAVGDILEAADLVDQEQAAYVKKIAQALLVLMSGSYLASASSYTTRFAMR